MGRQGSWETPGKDLLAKGAGPLQLPEQFLEQLQPCGCLLVQFGLHSAS